MRERKKEKKMRKERSKEEIYEKITKEIKKGNPYIGRRESREQEKNSDQRERGM